MLWDIKPSVARRFFIIHKSLWIKKLRAIHLTQRYREQTFIHHPRHWIKSPHHSDSTDNASIKEIVIIVLILDIISVLALQNEPIYSAFSADPHKACEIDSDCALKVATCHTCACDAVNKELEPLCIVKSGANECKPCNLGAFEIKCIKNTCQKVLK